MASNPSSQVYFVTGANRGLGFGFVSALLSRPNTTVIATVRNDEAAQSLETQAQDIPLVDSTALHIIKLDFSTAVPPEKISEAITALPAVDHIDVLISNAGCVPPMAPAAMTSAEHLRAAFEVNTIAPLLLFQAAWPLLQKAAIPKMISITSSVGSIGGQEPFFGGAYGPSRAAGNWITRALHIQHEGLVTIALHPGWVQTRAGYFVADQWNYATGPPETIENSVTKMLQVIDDATRETTSGKFLSYTSHEIPW
ncbi:hypothetical protein LOZ53_000572 [Ophidiomyces ophidiicola]|nr:hypothetical protein LOZ55_001342 [Ophidiomyces ophidiicola]KAI1997393.1 hypothetical protein LOZ53_000572 [Ophidiomyces ophidiicola]KAI1999494.1 hypothetical protein LOZ51_001982 [Ophidiomyces ophidiicola]